MIDKDGVDWIGLHDEEGFGPKGEYRGFPNAIQAQGGSYFHTMNVGTDFLSSVVGFESKEQVRITYTSTNI